MSFPSTLNYDDVVRELVKLFGPKTYLHIGLCYEILGLEEAQRAYRIVVQNYPEQTAEVAVARKNLNRLLASVDVPHKPTFRKIRIPTELSWSVRLSPDGHRRLK